MNTRMLTAVAISGVIGIAAGAAGIALLSDDGGGGAGSGSTIAPSILGAPDGSVLAAGLVQPTDCVDLAATMEALHEEYAYGGGAFPMAVRETMATDGMMDDSAEADFDAAAPASDGATLASGEATRDATNVQEVGVDEPDIVERVGDLVVTGTEGTIRVVEVVDGVPVERGSLEVQQWGGDLGLFAIGDDRVAVLSNGEGENGVRGDAARSMVRPGGWSTTVVTLVDLADPTAPVELSRVALEGWLVDARAVDGVLRVAVRGDGPQIDLYAQGEFEAERDFDWENATDEDYQRYEREFQAELEQRMEEARAQLEPTDWQPHADVDGTVQPLVGCDRIGFPTSFAGLGTLTMAAIDATGDRLAIDDAEAVVTSGENLYATTDRVVIATTRWEPCCEDDVVFEDVPEAPPVEPFLEEDGEAPAVEPLPAPPPAEPGDEEASAESAVLPMIEPGIVRPWFGSGGTTDLHVFDVEGTVVSHVASGSVDGSLLNQYSMSIHDGVLRTATTAWSGTGTESLVTTLRVEGTDLVQLGQVGDLGPDEDIQAVRFMGDTAYVVTFRRTDPLYVVDLSDPTAPTTRGELKIEGYSAYLHPLGGGQLLGVGQDADPETGFTRGTQVSTFDVSDATRPTRIDVDVTPDSSSEVEWEPHALTVTADRHAVVPIEVWDGNGRFGALVYRVEDSGELDRIGLLNTGSDWLLRPRRSLDLGDVLLTVGERGLVSWDRDGFTPLATLTFDPPAFEKEFEDGMPVEPGAGDGDVDFDREG